MTDAPSGKNGRETAKNGARRSNGTFAPGHDGGPGRPRGRRDAATVLSQVERVEELAAEDIDAIVRALVGQAKEGDTRAATVLLDRAAPQRRGSLVRFDLPRIQTVDDLRQAYNDVLGGVASGDLTLEEASKLFGLLEHHRKMLETVELQREVEALKEQLGVSG